MFRFSLFNLLGSILLLIIIFSILCFTMIFWLLVIFTRFFKQTNLFSSSFINFECGFLNYESIEVFYNKSIILLSIFFIIYDLEFLLILPFGIFSIYTNYFFIIIFIIIIIIFTIPLYFDIILNYSEWIIYY